MTERLARMKEQVYKDPRPPEYFDRFHQRARTREPDIIYDLARMLCSFLVWIVFRGRCISSENVPESGPVILAPNHFSFMDHFFVGAFVRRRVRFMAKSQLFKPPLQFIYTHGGVFPVRRGHHDEEAFITADKILERGGAIVMYCEGGRQRSGRMAERAKPGIGRLALTTGAPVLPVAIHGSSKVRNWKKLQFPNVTVQYGDPIRFERVEQSTREQQQAVADEILSSISELYRELERCGRRVMVQRMRRLRRTERHGERAATA